MLKRLNDVLRQQFGFSQGEIRGLYILLPLTTLIVLFPSFLKQVLKDDVPDHSADQAILEQWYIESKMQLTPDEIDIAQRPIRHFNPNKLSASEWMELGIKEKVAQRIVNYRLKGGRFNTPEDLLKIYGINKPLIQSYSEYMVIPKIEPKPVVVTRKLKTKPVKKEFVKFDLNAADTTTFQTINGIGPYWSRRLVRYREALGGFVAPDQVYELYGLDSSLARVVVDHTYLKKSTVMPISINQDSTKVLARHPYISYKTANAIVKYRKSHGDYRSVTDLKKLVLISDSLYQKINPYLSVE